MNTLNTEQLANAQKANAEMLSTLMRTAFNGLERLSALNMAASRDFFNAAVGNVQQLLAVKDPSELSRLNTSLAQPTLDKWMEYTRNVYDLVTNVQKEVANVVEGQYESFAKTASAGIDKTKAAPGGDILAAAMKSMLDASSRAFEQMNAMTRQVGDIAEANLQAAANSTTQAVAGSAAAKAAASAAKK